jgi:uncharacterized protein (DUF433 family)
MLDQLAAGLTNEEIIADFPELEPDDIQAWLQFASDQADWQESELHQNVECNHDHR